MEARLGLRPVDSYIAQRQLRWAGHVARMDFETRLPRKFLSSWVRHKRPLGRPQTAYGHGLAQRLKDQNIDLKRWHELAADRDVWRKLTLL